MAIGSIINTSTLTGTFDGEFNNGFISSPDGSTGLWQTSLMNGNRTLSPNGEQEYYSDSSVGYNPFSVQNGVLNITAKPSSAAGANALGLPYDSGVITTESSFSQLYGYFEIDAKLPAGQGLWPAFWMLPASGAWPPELDVFEVLGNNPSTLYFSTHSGVQATASSTLNVANTSSGFNLYGVMWGPQTVDLYINNVEVASMPTPADMNVPMYMLANLAVGGSWPGSPNSSTPFPAVMQVAYIKAFAYPGTTGGTVYDTLPSQNIGAAALAPVITAPGSVAAASGVIASLGGISFAANWPGGEFTATVSDYSGLLKTAATNDVAASGENSTTLTLTGHLASINAALATLTYNGTPTGPDYLWVGVKDPQGQLGTASVVVNVGTSAAPAVTTPGTLSATAGARQALAGIGVADSQASGNVTLVLSDGTGLLSTTSVAGVTAQGEATKSLTLTGSLAALNADLATLTYQAGAAAGTDQIAVAFTDAAGKHASGGVSVTVASAATGGKPVVSMPASFTATSGTTQAIAGISVADSQATGTVTVVLGDATGLLSTSAPTGVTEQGEGTTKLTLVGTLAAINADLASLTYKAGATAGTDSLVVTASANGVAGSGTAAIAVNASSVGATPVVTTPATATVSAGTSLALGSVSVADSAGGALTVTISDSTGLLHTGPQSGLTETGEGTTSLTLSGSLAAINADLASLTYQADQTTGTDWVWVSANAGNAPQALNHAVVTITAPPVAPVVTAPATAAVAAGAIVGVSGVSVADSIVGTMSVTVSDSTGLLHTGPQSGLTMTGEGTTSLTLSGSLAAINADLASLTYQAGQTTGTDWLWISANAANAPQGIGHVVVTVAPPVVAASAVAPVVTVPASFTAVAGTTDPLTGVSVADSQAGVTITVALADKAGLLTTNPATGVSEQGEGTTMLTLVGSVASINADLATLTYRAGAATGTDPLTVTAAANGAQAAGSVAITVTAPPAPVATSPAGLILAAGTTGGVAGVRVADSAGANLTVMVSDSAGLLHVAAVSGLVEGGENTTALTLTGSVGAINAGLATLTYQAAAASGTDWLWVSANAVNAPQGLSHTVVTVMPAPTSVITGLQTGAGVTLLDGSSSIQGSLQVDGGHVLENTGALVWNTGSIALGSGDTSTTNQTGTLANDKSATITITGAGSVNNANSTGSGSIINAGTILKSTGTGATTVYAPLNNTGIVDVTAGSLVFEKAVTGSGTLEIGGMATLDFASTVGAGSTMRFLASEGTLEVQATGTFGATILGFAAGATIDAASLPLGSGTTLNFAAVGNTDTLTVSGGGHTAVFNLQGNYTPTGFHMTPDGHGGTGITYS